MRVVELPDHFGGDQGSRSGPAPSGPLAAGPIFPGPADAGDGRFASRLRDTLGARRAREQAHLEDIRGSDARALREAKKAGAKHALTMLELGDEWIAYHGYRNPGGEIHQLLLGPRGLVAMTSLHLDATVRCNGDKWHAERTDRTGQALGSLSLDDHRGRSPGKALHEPADVLEKWLHSSGHQLRVHRAILLNHPGSFKGEWHRPTVQVFTSASNLVNWLNGTPKVLDRNG
jgi:Nuclease-related domain